MKNDLTQARLKELLIYSRSTGLFTWRVNHGKKIKAGQVAGAPQGMGYIQVQVDGYNYLAHRLAYLYVRGRFPVNQIDQRDGQRDGQRDENCWANLRVSTVAQNAQNIRQATKRSLVGLLGVSRNGKRWKSNIRVDKKLVHLGTFDTPELAHAAYVEAKRKHHPFSTL